MNIETAISKTLALALWGKNPAGEDDVAVFPGVLAKKDGAYFLVRESGVSPELREEWLPRIEAVDNDLREMLCNCEYVLSLTVGDAEDSDTFLESFGLQWPS